MRRKRERERDEEDRMARKKADGKKKSINKYQEGERNGEMSRDDGKRRGCKDGRIEVD